MRRRRRRPASELTGPGSYRIEEEEPGVFRILGDGEAITTYRGTREGAEEYLARHQQEEAEVRAIATGDATRLCALGWHRRLESYGLLFFRFGNGRPGEMLIFKIGRVPLEIDARTIWCYGEDATPWPCDACGRAIPDRVGGPGQDVPEGRAR